MADEMADAPSTEVSIETLVEQLTKERNDFKDMALRVQAEFENYRKRAGAQLADEVDRNAGRIVESLLTVLDACQAAIAHNVVGVEPVLESLLLTLGKLGLEPLELVGTEFDPSLAEAVLHEPSDDGSDKSTVVETLRSGYRWKGRVLRAAMVKVKG